MSKAFSLVELSIVLVILGLLAGGVLSGRQLIRAAELRAVSTEHENIITAITTFKNKYHQLPGDMPSATKFWGDNTTHCADASVNDGTPGTCNGNGDGIIQQDASGGGAVAEGYMMWQHLSNASLISGEYSGTAGIGSPDDDDIGENVPSSRLPSAGWNIEDQNFIAGGDGVNYSVNHGSNHLEFGSVNAMTDSDGAILTPEEAWSIDKKLDDGRPAYGKVLSRYLNNTCTTAADSDDTDSEYNVQNNSVQCPLLFVRHW